MFNNHGNNGGGNPNHDENGRFTSSGNGSSPKGENTTNKLKKMGFSGEEKEPTKKYTDMGYSYDEARRKINDEKERNHPENERIRKVLESRKKRGFEDTGFDEQTVRDTGYFGYGSLEDLEASENEESEVDEDNFNWHEEVKKDPSLIDSLVVSLEEQNPELYDYDEAIDRKDFKTANQRRNKLIDKVKETLMSKDNPDYGFGYGEADKIIEGWLGNDATWLKTRGGTDQDAIDRAVSRLNKYVGYPEGNIPNKEWNEDIYYELKNMGYDSNEAERLADVFSQSALSYKEAEARNAANKLKDMGFKE